MTPRPAPLHVVVVGASLAGLFAAAAAAGAGHTVTVIERDELTVSTLERPGVPQGQQPHVFLLRGLLAAESLIPGLRGDLESAGSVPFDSATLAWLGEQGWAPYQHSAFEVLSLTRPLFEQVVRRRVLALSGIELLAGRRVTGLRPDRAGWLVEMDEDEPVGADLVVDASGRASRMPQWLAALGIAVPPVDLVDARMGYASRMYTAAPAMGRLSGIVLQATPRTPVGGLVVPVQDDCWLVLALGMGDRRPPRDNDGFEKFLGELPDPAVADFVRSATPVGDVVVHRQTANSRRHYERLRDWPDGLISIGDAFCSFNPVYGQGITVSACEAVLLGKALQTRLRSGDSRRLLRRFAKMAALPWQIAIGQDLRHPSTEGRQSFQQALSNAWVRQVAALGVHGNDRAVNTLTRLFHLMGPPRMLLHPALFGAAIRARVIGPGPASSRPTDLRSLVSQRLDHP
jgi:2-polyprenyl-6-methoxyphenol hydroxylase-like FAD-dependent oxidoreductase